MAKVLLVDTNFSSGPIYEALLAGGHEVHVVGANPLDCLAKVSPHYWNLNYADTHSLAELVHRQGFDYLVPGCTDRSYESCVAINDGRFPGLDNSDAAKAISNKAQFRRLADQLRLPVPRAHSPDLKESLLPVVVKPVDAFSGKGITVLYEQDPQKLSAAIETARDASPSREYLIQEFVEGQLHSHSAFISDRRVVQDFVVQEDRTANPFVVDTSRVLASVSSDTLARLRSCVDTLAMELRLADGLLHTQFISDGKDFWLIELTRRCPGDLYSQLVELSTDYPYTQSYILPFLGQKVPTFDKPIASHPIMRHTLTLKSEQGLAFVRFKCALQIERWVPLSLVGDRLRPSPHSRVAILFCRTPNQQDLDQIYQRTLQRDLYDVQA